jgi:hypothetical protein
MLSAGVMAETRARTTRHRRESLSHADAPVHRLVRVLPLLRLWPHLCQLPPL